MSMCFLHAYKVYPGPGVRMPLHAVKDLSTQLIYIYNISKIFLKLIIRVTYEKSVQELIHGVEICATLSAHVFIPCCNIDATY